jgi:general stress protein 26
MTDVAGERQRIRALIEQAGVAILMNVDENGAQVGRPMLPLFVPDDPDLYFMTHHSSRKVTQLGARSEVGVAITAADCYVVIAGSAHVSRDPELIRRLWNPTYRAWFPEGKDDRDAAVIRVAVDRIDYWEPPAYKVVRLVQAVKAVLTGQPVDTPKKTLDGL